MEIQILNWLQSLHTPILDKIMQLITHLGDLGIIWIILTI
ncbi:phosphatase PAP2 family protein, partial [[Ruminococcus] torques]|nr:phosphatase PAP2 family protein [[Ruminococcus] torques]